MPNPLTFTLFVYKTRSLSVTSIVLPNKAEVNSHLSASFTEPSFVAVKGLTRERYYHSACRLHTNPTNYVCGYHSATFDSIFTPSTHFVICRSIHPSSMSSEPMYLPTYLVPRVYWIAIS